MPPLPQASAVSALPASLGLPPFRARPPWCGADLQTLRDSLRPVVLPPDCATPLTIPIGGGDRLLALLERPPEPPRGLVLVVPGLGGEAGGRGPRRLALVLCQAGYASLRLNLRGAGAGRSLAGGTYAARCDRDLQPVLEHLPQLARSLAGSGRDLPRAAVGLSLGGTILLHACRAGGGDLAALACLSSPLDLAGCSAAIGRRRNALYQRWLVHRLRRQTLADPLALTAAERSALLGPAAPRTIRAFDELITAPRWGHPDVDAYYADASPLPFLLQQQPGGPAILLLHAEDDPWVPAGPTAALAAGRTATGRLQVLLTSGGGHCGFHALGDPPLASWSDRLLVAWVAAQLG